MQIIINIFSHIHCHNYIINLQAINYHPLNVSKAKSDQIVIVNIKIDFYDNKYYVQFKLYKHAREGTILQSK